MNQHQPRQRQPIDYGLLFWFLLLLAALIFRQYGLDESPAHHWDLLLVFFLGGGVLVLRRAAQHVLVRAGMILGLTGLAVALFFKYELQTVLSLPGLLLGLGGGIGLVVLLSHMQRWYLRQNATSTEKPSP